MIDALLNRLGFLVNGLGVGLGRMSPVADHFGPGMPLQFLPRVTPDFHPLVAVLEKGGLPYPVIVEGADIPHARRVLEGELHRQFENFLTVTPPFEAALWIALVRSPDGTAEGLALSWLLGRGRNMKMRCEQDRKLVLSGEESIRHVGIALLIAKLRWMKGQGCWGFGQEILNHYDPVVMASYRRTCGLEKGWFDDLTIATSSVHRGDAETFLRQCPISILPLRLPGPK